MYIPNAKAKSSGTSSLLSVTKNASRPTSPGPGTHSGIDKEVALKIISKKKVKGNEASVWSEMEVLKGLNHPNIVGFILSYFISIE